MNWEIFWFGYILGMTTMVLFIFLKEWQHERTTQTIVKGKSQ